MISKEPDELFGKTNEKQKLFLMLKCVFNCHMFVLHPNLIPETLLGHGRLSLEC